MSLQAVRNVVLLFSSPTRSNGHTVPSTILRNITALSSQLAYSESIAENVTTLSTNSALTTKGTIQGLLYVPDIDDSDACYTLSNQYIPENATRQEDLPPTDYILIALVPWINNNCTKSFMAAAAIDPLHAMLVYRPDDDDGPPPDSGSDLWNLGAGWKDKNHFPIYAVSSSSGDRMMQQLSLYSGKLSEVPFADEINKTYSPNPADYVRVWTQLTVVPEPSLLAIWALVLIILAVILSVVGGISLLMHYVQSRRRSSLRRRVLNGEINLEALGIKRLTVPLEHVRTYPLFTYNYDPPAPTSPNFSNAQKSPTKISFESISPSGHARGHRSDRLDYQPTCLICLDDFESKVSIIRELSCGHIFHPECVDEFLSEMSSLCPLCKTSMYPRGLCPRITNSMVRRELSTRKLRSSRSSHSSPSSGWRRLRARHDSEIRPVHRRVSMSTEPTTSIHLQKSPSPNAPNNARERMQELVTPIDETSSDDGRPPWSRAARALFPGFS